MQDSTRSPRPKKRLKQRWLPIDAAPQKVRDHGLGDAHSRPLVSPGKIAGVVGVSFRVAPWAAWFFPSLELRAENSTPALILDFDGRGSYERLTAQVSAGKGGPLNWAVENLRSGGVHGVWTLANPVHRGDNALLAPLRRWARISEYYAAAFGADAGYTGVLTHNPMEKAQLTGFRTHWLRQDPYSLGELSDYIPFRWRKPKVSRTAAGRNCDVFCHCMRWAGSPANLQRPVFNEAHRVNDGFPVPLDPPEVAGIARSVERYRRKWSRRGQFGPVGDAERTAWGRERGIKGGLARRKRTQDRDQAIVQAWLSGASIHSLSRLHGLSRPTVRHVLQRDAPLWQRGGGETN